MQKKLSDVLDVAEERLLEICKKKESLYRVYPVHSGKSCRWIEAPEPDLKYLQRKILETLLYDLAPTLYAHGFVPGRSIATHAEPHVGKPYVVVTDIVQFFPSVQIDQVRDVCRALPLSAFDLECLAQLLTRRDRLPQGSPASPHIANLVLNPMDLEIVEALEPYGWTYTRYADDLAFSGNEDPRPKLEMVRGIVEKHGFKTSNRKSRIMGRHRRQNVTGLVVNDKISIPRERKRTLRAIKHRIQSEGWPAVEPPDPEKVMGMLAYESFISDYSKHDLEGAQT